MSPIIRTRMAATQTMLVGDLAIDAGRTASTHRGNGAVPIALSTAIFRGIGVSSAIGAESSVSRNTPHSRGQTGRATSSSRRYNAGVE